MDLFKLVGSIFINNKEANGTVKIEYQVFVGKYL